MKTHCCPGLIVSVAVLILGGSAAAIWPHIPGSCGSHTASVTGPLTSPSVTSPGDLQPGPDSIVSAWVHGQERELASLVAADRKENAKDEVKKIPAGKNVTIEIEGEKRRVVIQSYVCLRQGSLEQLLTTKNGGKSHESILAADLDAKAIHFALLACGAKAGHPVRFGAEKIEPPTGTTIKVTLEYKNKDDKLVRFPAQQWMRSIKTKKDLGMDWVFAGSVFIPIPDDPKAPPTYGANFGDVICVANMEMALLDLPTDFKTDSERGNGDINFEAHTERIPAVDTPVTVILEPVLEKKKK